MKITASLVAIGIAFTQAPSVAPAQSPADLNDLEIAHVAYNSTAREFAETMIRDHNAINEWALPLLVGGLN